MFTAVPPGAQPVIFTAKAPITGDFRSGRRALRGHPKLTRRAEDASYYKRLGCVRRGFKSRVERGSRPVPPATSQKGAEVSRKIGPSPEGIEPVERYLVTFWTVERLKVHNEGRDKG